MIRSRGMPESATRYSSLDPRGEGWRLPDLEEAAFFDRLSAAGTPWLTALQGCPQDPIHHAEGDVFTHTGMVCRALVRLPGFLACTADEQQILAWSALLHDIAKPLCNLVEGARISSPGHALKGSLAARRILWELDCPFALREEVVGLVAHHMVPTWALERDDPTRLVRRLSLDCRCRLLALLVEADMLGRICADQADLLGRLQLFGELMEEAGVATGPAEFASDLSRYRYFQGSWHNPELAPHEDFRCRVVMMSGLPGAGKDTWIAEHYRDWAVISLDALRERMGVAPSAPQAGVVDAAREIARGYLRQGRDFVWNATNVSVPVRQKALSLFFDYRAHVTIVYLECPRRRLFEQNRRREASVPAPVMQKLLGKWEVPRATEAHTVEYQVS